MADRGVDWAGFRAILVQLFMVQGKTLSEVKGVMEKDHGFSTDIPLSIYQTRLRDRLGLRKNLKGSDWTTIYRCTYAQGLREFNLFYNDIRIQPSRMRKNFSRYHCRDAVQPGALPVALPDGVEVRRVERESPGLAASNPPEDASVEPLFDTDMVDFDDDLQIAVDLPTEMMDSAGPGHDIRQNSAHLTHRSTPGVQSEGDFLAQLGSLTPFSDWNRWGMGSHHEGSPSRPPSGPGGTLALFRTPTPQGSLFALFEDPIDSLSNISANFHASAEREAAVLDVEQLASLNTFRILALESFPYSMMMVSDRHLWARYHLKSLPWYQYRLRLQAMRGDGQGPTTTGSQHMHQWSLPPDTVADFSHGARNALPAATISDTSFPVALEVYRSLSTSGALSINLDLYQILAQVVYLLSNNLHDGLDDKHIIPLFGMLASGAARRLVLSIFKGKELSIRAVWEKLFDIACRHSARSGLELLLRVALQFHNVWLTPKVGQAMIAAASIGDKSLVKELLDKWPEWRPESCTDPTCFGAAAACGAVDCAKLLLGICDPNDIIVHMEPFSARNSRESMFTLFVKEFVQRFEKPWRRLKADHSDVSPYVEILNLFVASGADVDTVFSREVYGNKYFEWDMTCLDICCYMAPRTFALLSPASLKLTQEITRAGVCNAVLASTDSQHNALVEYLESKSTPPGLSTSDCLRIVLIEQFKIFDTDDYGDSSRNYKVLVPDDGIALARALVEFGVALRAWVYWDPVTCLKTVLRTAMTDGLNEDLIYLLDHALEAGADIEPAMYWECAEEQNAGTTVLRALASRDVDCAANGVHGLVAAGQRLNLEAVSLLLDMGVDINDSVDFESSLFGRDNRFTPLAHLLTKSPFVRVGDGAEQRRKVWDFFIAKGAQPRLRRGHGTCYQLLRQIIDTSSDFQKEAFHYVLSLDQEAGRISAPQWTNLFSLAVENMQIDFSITKELFRRSVPSYEPFLAQAIMRGCDMNFMEDLLVAGEDVNDYSGGRSPLQAAASRLDPAMAARLLELGARVDLPTAEELQQRGSRAYVPREPRSYQYLEDLGLLGGTALHFACQTDAETPLRMERQQRLITLLLNHGADVNANVHLKNVPAPMLLLLNRNHSSAAAAQHTRGLISLLLAKGANINIPPPSRQLSAWHYCAEHGDIELAMTLVEYDVDPNAYLVVRRLCTQSACCCTIQVVDEMALDVAAQLGRLDMTQYLLHIGALSSIPGSTGYKGAHLNAMRSGHDAVVEIIGRHSQRVEQKCVRDPDFRSRRLRIINKHVAAMNHRTKACRRQHPKKGGERSEASSSESES